MTSNTETTETAEAPVTEQSKATKKPGAGARGAHVASEKSKSGKEGQPGHESAQAQKRAGAGRDGSKTPKVLDLRKRPGGVTAKDLTRATGWQPLSVWGFLSGTSARRWAWL